MARLASISVVSRGTLGALALICSCLSSDPEPGVDDPIPPIDAAAPEVFETATFSLG